MDFGMTVRTDAPFAQVVGQVRRALAEQGFGVLTEIDVRATLHAKLGEDMEDYLILGACNPLLAHRALAQDRQIGLLLPCNVVVRTSGRETLVEALDPMTMVEITGQETLGPIAAEAASRLRAALASI